MKLYLSIDSGGTKMRAILFNEQLELVGEGIGGSANTNFDSPEVIAAHTKQCLEPCLLPAAGRRIEAVYLTTLGAADTILAYIRATNEVGEVIPLNEGMACMRAGIQQRNGTVAIAGTGAIVVGIDHERTDILGGWGSWIGDEGSGYDLGKQAINAAIRDYEGRGPHTQLTADIVQRFQMDTLHDLFQLLYGAPSIRAFIASVSPLVSQAAKQGDQVARTILHNGGNELASVVLAMFRRNPNLLQYPVTLGGSVWKGAVDMFDSFAGTLVREHPQIQIVLPTYEPVMSGVIDQAMQRSNLPAAAHDEGQSASTRVQRDELYAGIAIRFSSFLYRVDWS